MRPLFASAKPTIAPSGRLVGVEIKIGVREIGRELNIETEQSPEQIEQDLRTALSSPGGVLVLQADKGRRVLIPAASIGYVDLGQTTARRVGFGFGDGNDSEH